MNTPQTRIRWSLALVAAVIGGLAFGACAPPAGGGTKSAATSADASSPSPSGSDETIGVPVYDYEIVNTYSHDRGSYTQGLVFNDGLIYESTGRNGESTLRAYKPETGQVLRKHDLDQELFGEGLAMWKELLIQLTWKSKQAIVYDRRNFQELYRHEYKGEGWGLTFDGESLVMSDGTHTLRFLEPKTFEEKRRMKVTLNGNALWDLNELEYIDGEIWANLYQDERIARIDPETGKVTSIVDLTGLQKKQNVRDKAQDVLNGIAWDAEGKRLFITGKYWPNLYEIRVVEKE